MVTIEESGMVFGPFHEDEVYHIEHAEEFVKLGGNIKVVEFILKKPGNKVFFIEAKSSSPKPAGETFKDYINDIADKFIDSFNFLLTIKLDRRKGKVSEQVLDFPIDKQIFRFILIVKNDDDAWLPPIKDALDRRMVSSRKIWGHEIIVLNDKMAKKRGLIS